MTTLKNFQDVELEVKKTNLEVERLLTDVRLILDRINHITGISGSFSPTPSLTTDHGILSGLGDDDHPHYLLASGTRELTGNWDAGPFSITAETLISDVAIGTAPLTVTSTTVVPNLNVDQVDGFHLDQDVTSGSSPTFDGTNFTGIDISDATNLAGGSGITLNDDTVDLDINSLAAAAIVAGDFVPFWDITATATNKKITFANLEGAIDHGNIAGTEDDDHSQYALLAGRATGQTLIGGTASGEDLTLQSTAHATRGSILLGSSAYDEVNDRWGVNTAVPGTTLDVNGDLTVRSGIIIGGTNLTSTSAGVILFDTEAATTAGLIYRPLESTVYASRYCLMFDTTDDASFPFLTNRTPSGAVVIKTGTAAGGGENEHFRIKGGDGIVSAYFTNVNLGVGTSDIPHGGVGSAKFAIEGINASASGPHVQFTTASDNYPLLSIIPWAHDNTSIMWDAYWGGGSVRSADIGSNFNLTKTNDALRIYYDSGVAAGSGITWKGGFVLNASGNTGFGLAIAVAPAAKVHIDQSVSGTAIPVLALDQANTSEEFINFVAAIGAGNPVDTAAIGTYYGKVRVAVNGTFKYIALYNS